MKLDNYIVSKIKDQVSEFLFIIWLEGGLKDSKDPEIKELYELYHEILARQVSVTN